VRKVVCQGLKLSGFGVATPHPPDSGVPLLFGLHPSPTLIVILELSESAKLPTDLPRSCFILVFDSRLYVRAFLDVRFLTLLC